MASSLDIERLENGVRVLWIDNPDHRNAMNNDLIHALTEALERLSDEEDCRLIVLRGRGGVFCAGRELRDLKALQDADLDTVVEIYTRLRKLNEAFYHCDKPIVALVEKYALGLGVTMVSWCDLALADESARMAYPEALHGFPPSPAIPALLKGGVFRKHMMELMLSGKRIDAGEARRMGLINTTFAPGAAEEALAEFLADFLKTSGGALARTKAFIRFAEDAGHRGGMESAVDSISLGVTSADAQARIAAFLNR